MKLQFENLRGLSPDFLLAKDGLPFIELDLTTGQIEVGVSKDTFKGGEPFNGKIRYELSHRIDASGIYDWINRDIYFDFEDLISKGEEISDLGRSLVRICKHYVPQLSFLAGFWSADQWLNREDTNINNYKISINTAYFDIMRLADKIVEDAREVYAILDIKDVQDYLVKYQEDLQPIVKLIDMSAIEHLAADCLLTHHGFAYLSFNLSTATITAQIEEIFADNVRNFRLHKQVDASKLKVFCETNLLDLLNLLFEGSVKNFNSEKAIIYLTREAEDVCLQIADVCLNNVPILSEDAGFWDAHQWLKNKAISIPEALNETEAIELAAQIVGQARLLHAYIDEEEMAVALLEITDVA